jgi:hypothetical protein
MAGIQGNKINYMCLLLDFPQYKEVFFTPLLKHLTNFHKNISKFHNNVHIFKILLRNHLVKNAFYSIEEFLSMSVIINWEHIFVFTYLITLLCIYLLSYNV